MSNHRFALKSILLTLWMLSSRWANVQSQTTLPDLTTYDSVDGKKDRNTLRGAAINKPPTRKTARPSKKTFKKAPSTVRSSKTPTTKGANDITLLMKSAETCKSFPDDKKVCFGNEETKYGLASCDSKANVFSEEACCVRIIGLQSCVGKEVFDSCNLGEVVSSLYSAACDVFLPSILSSTKSETLNATSWSLQPNQEMHEKPIVTTYALSDDILVPSNSSEIHKNITGVVERENRELQSREQFTQTTVAGCQALNTKFGPNSCIIVSDEIGHRVQGDNAVYQIVTFWDGLVRYRYYLYTSRGSAPFYFYRNGDGGYQNWAFNGYFIRDSDRSLVNSLNFQGARVYEHINFGGYVRYLPGTSIKTSTFWYNFESFGNDAISSVDVSPGCFLTMFEDSYMQGAYKMLTAGTWSYVGNDWNDRMSSCLVWCWGA